LLRMRQCSRRLTGKRKIACLIGTVLFVYATIYFLHSRPTPLELPGSGIIRQINSSRYDTLLHMRSSDRSPSLVEVAPIVPAGSILLHSLSPPVHSFSFEGTSPERIRTELDDVMFSVKTTGSLHSKRVDLILRTWFQQCRNQVRVSHN